MEESKKKRSLQEKVITFPEKVCLTQLGFLFVCFLMLSGKPRPISKLLESKLCIANGERKRLGRLERQSGFGHISFL